MAGLQTWALGLMALALTLVLTRAETASSGSSEIVRKESRPELPSKKRGFSDNHDCREQSSDRYLRDVDEGRCHTSPGRIGDIMSALDVNVKRCRVEGMGVNSALTVDDEGTLFVGKAPDPKDKKFYYKAEEEDYCPSGKLACSLRILMCDKNDALVGSGTVFVFVKDIEDNDIIFPTYSGSIRERCRIGTEVVAVTATDADDPARLQGTQRYLNGALLLRPEGELSAFEIDSITGVVRSRSDTLDHETRSKYGLVVQARDLGGKPAGPTAATTVTIAIADINDNIASFTRQTYEFQVPEDQKLNEQIGTLTLEDRDEIQSKDPVFTITPPFHNMFEVKLGPVKDGDLVLRQVLDYETSSSYSFTVHVWGNNLETPADNADGAITSAQVNIKVDKQREADLKMEVGFYLLIAVLVCLPAILGILMWRMRNNQLVAYIVEDGIKMSNDQLVPDNVEDGIEMSSDELVADNREDGAEIRKHQLVANNRVDGGEDQLIF